MNDNQKRALGISAIGLVAVYVVRSRSKGTRVATAPVSPAGSVAPYTPQTPLPLPPGESVYDPNSQALLTTPTGFPPQTTAPQQPGYVVNVTYPKPVTAKKPTKKPSKRKPTTRKQHVVHPPKKHHTHTTKATS